jgi:hypothetical protein
VEIRAADLPELKADLMAYLGSAKAAWFFEDRASGSVFRGWPARQIQACEVAALANSEMYHVAQPMLDLAMTAAGTLPPFVLEPADLPSRAGFMFLGSGVARLHPTIGEIAAVHWGETTGGRVVFTFYADAEHVVTQVLAEGQATKRQAAQYHAEVGRLAPMALEACMLFGTRTSTDKHGLEPMLRVIRSVWLLMQQPLASATEAEPNRAAQKRLRRAGHEPKPVRVIELRRPANNGGQGDGSREYHHQWIVRGHWRQQWHPKRQVHRPVWIAPHIKGPDDAPLLGGEKVYAWKR